MRNRLIFCVALAAALAPAAAAETRTYNLSGFKEISASSSADVVLKQGPFSVVAETNNGDFTDLVVELQGDRLVVGRKSRSGSWIKNTRYVVTVTAPAIEELHASSSADIRASDYKFQDLKASASSSGDLFLSGSCNSLKVSVNSSGDFKGSDLKCATADVSASSSGDADVYATQRAVGNASSSGDVRFYGKPASVDKNTSSSGKIKVL